MKHFTDEAWLDFARRLLPAEEMSRMRAHLDAGCPECAELFGLWEAVTQAASRESHYTPDESIVAAVKSAFDATAWKRAPLTTRIAALMFDSFAAAPAMAGIRSISAAARHLLYQVGSLTIDLRLDAHGGRGMTIAGQVLGTEADVREAASGEVRLLQRDTTIARTFMNDFGEFQLDGESGPDLRISLEISGQEPVVLTLPE